MENKYVASLRFLQSNAISNITLLKKSSLCSTVNPSAKQKRNPFSLSIFPSIILEIDLYSWLVTPVSINLFFTKFSNSSLVVYLKILFSPKNAIKDSSKDLKDFAIFSSISTDKLSSDSYIKFTICSLTYSVYCPIIFSYYNKFNQTKYMLKASSHFCDRHICIASCG